MVGPAPPEERRRSLRRLQIGFVLLVGLSSALIAFSRGVELPLVLGAGLAGGLVGLLLVWFALPTSLDTGRS